MRPLKIISLLILLLTNESAFANTNWNCTYHSSDGSVTVKTLFSKKADTLVGVLDEVGNRETRFKILDDSTADLIAVSVEHLSAQSPKIHLTVVMINKKTGALEMTGFAVGTSYQDAYRGTCVEK